MSGPVRSREHTGAPVAGADLAGARGWGAPTCAPAHLIAVVPRWPRAYRAAARRTELLKQDTVARRSELDPVRHLRGRQGHRGARRAGRKNVRWPPRPRARGGRIKRRSQQDRALGLTTQHRSESYLAGVCGRNVLPPLRQSRTRTSCLMPQGRCCISGERRRARSVRRLGQAARGQVAALGRAVNCATSHLGLFINMRNTLPNS